MNIQNPPSRAKLFARVLGIGSLLLGSCNLPSRATGETPQAPLASVERLRLQGHAIRLEAGVLTYGFLVSNPTSEAVGGVRLQVSVPEASSVEEIVSIPLDSDVSQSGSEVAWELQTFPASTVLGPFAFRSTSGDADAIEIEATVTWESPSAGRASITLNRIEEASEMSATADLPGLAVADMGNTWFVLSQGGRTQSAPLGPPSGSGGGDHFTEVEGTGVRAVSVSGDRGAVTVTRSSVQPPASVAQNVTWVAVYEVTKEIPGSAILVVPLRVPAPPLSLVRVFADHGQGYVEQDIMGLVTEDGLHASFAAEGESTYALGVYVEEVSNWSASIPALANGLRGLDTNEGIAASVQASFEEISSLTSLGENLLAMIIQQTGAASGGDPVETQSDSQHHETDSDMDGVSNDDEDYLGTDPDDPDTDGDGLDDWLETEVTHTDPLDADSDNDTMKDGDEVNNGTDPHTIDDPDSDEDGLTDSTEDAYGSDPGDSDSDDDGHSDGDELASGSDPNSANSTPTPAPTQRPGFAPVPGCGGFLTCFSDGSGMYGMGDTLLGDTLQDFLGLPTEFGLLPGDLGSTATNGNQVQGPTGGRLDAGGLVSIVGVIGGRIFICIPGGQEIQAILGSGSPLLDESAPETPTPAGPPSGVTTSPTSTQPPAQVPPTATRTPTPILDTTGPAFKSVSDSPDPIYVNQPAGCSPNTSVVSASVSDPSGVANVVVLFFHTTIGAVPMTNTGGDNWQATLGPYGGVGDGTLDYQVRSTDNHGNISDSAFYQITVLACIP